MSGILPSEAYGLNLDAARTVTNTAAYENEVYNNPFVWSWIDAQTPDGTGLYLDRARRGYNWQQPTTGKQPALTSNWLSTGHSAFLFDGVDADDQGIPFLGEMPLGEQAVFALVSLATGSTSGTVYSLLGSSRGAPTTEYHYGQFSGKPYVSARTTANGATNPSALTVNTPYVVELANSATQRKTAVSVNGATYTQTAYTSFLQTPCDPSAILGNKIGLNAANPWFGNIQALIVLNVYSPLLTDSTRSNITRMLAARAGITVPI